MPVICAPKIRASVARGVLYVIRIYPLLGNGPINTHSLQQKTVFSVGSVPRGYLEDNRCYKQLSVQLWSANQRATEAEESPSLRFVPGNV
jgi:hypothetical protein